MALSPDRPQQSPVSYENHTLVTLSYVDILCPQLDSEYPEAMICIFYLYPSEKILFWLIRSSIHSLNQ